MYVTGKMTGRQVIFKTCIVTVLLTGGPLLTLFSILATAPDWAIDNYVNHEFPLVFPCITAAMEGLECDLEEFKRSRSRKKQLLKRCCKESNDGWDSVTIPIHPTE